MANIGLSAVPVALLDSVQRIAEVYQMSIIKGLSGSTDNRKDVLLVSPSGEREMISRIELRDNYVSLDDKRISIIKLSYEIKYTVMRVNSIDCVALKAPKNGSNVFIREDGSSVKPGNVLVMPLSSVGGMYVNMGSAAEIDPRVFKKLYVIKSIAPAVYKHVESRVNSNNNSKNRSFTDEIDSSAVGYDFGEF